MGAFDFIGDLFNKSARDRAASAQHDAIDNYKVLDPTITAQETGPNAYDSASTDPATRDAQMAALNQLATIGSTGGMDPGSVAALQQAQMSNAQQAKSNTDAALERAQAEGRLNSGRALSAQIQAGQGAANSNAMAGTQAAADARTRAMQALSATGQLGGSIRGADYGQASDKANAQNMINQFNATQRQGAQQQTFGNSATKAQGIAAGDQAIAGTDQNRAQQARESAGAIGDAVVSGVTKAATGFLSDGGMVGYADGGPVAHASYEERLAKREAERKADQDRNAKVDAATLARLSCGGKVPGYAHGGDSKNNDTVPAMLSPGEVVIPRSIMQGDDPAQDAAEFIRSLLKHKG